MSNEGLIDLQTNIPQKTAKFDKNLECSDVIFCIEGEKIPAHRFILAAHSDDLKTLLYETEENEIPLKDVPVEAFKILLTFFYTGKLRLNDYSIKDVVDLLELSYLYKVPDLKEKLIEYLSIVVSAETVAQVFRVALVVDASIKIQEKCWTIFEMIIDGYYTGIKVNLSFEQLLRLLKRPRKITEVKLFQFIIDSVSDEEERKQLISRIKFPRMIPEQLKVVWASKVLDPVTYIDLLECFVDFKIADKNIILTPVVLEGDNPQFVFEKNSQRYATHENGGCIKVDLGSNHLINHLRFNLGQRWCTYYIEVSRNETEEWHRVLDYSPCVCSSDQILYFPEIVGRYIKFVGFDVLHEELFGMNSLEIKYVTNPPKSLGGFTLPHDNVATNDRAEAWITSLDGELRTDFDLLNEHFEETLTTYTVHDIQKDLVVVLKQPVIINSCRFKFWDGDCRKYKYKVTISEEMVECKNDEFVNGWQTIKFSPRVVHSVRITGIECTNGHELRLVHFEAPAQQSTDILCDKARLDNVRITNA